MALDAAARGALTGAVTGLLIGWLFAIFTWFDPRIASGWLIVDGLWFGTLVGFVMGLAMYLITKPRRRFDAVSRMQPAYSTSPSTTCTPTTRRGCCTASRCRRA